jgi:hypothetical protein
MSWFMLVILGAIVAILFACGGGSSQTATAPPIEAVRPRTDVLYGYFGDVHTSEVKDHTNVQMLMGWMSASYVQAANAGAIAPDMKFIYYSGWNLDTIRWQLTQFRSLGLLGSIVAIYPEDEPDVQGRSAKEVGSLLDNLKVLMLEFPELKDVKYAVIYGSNGTPGIERYDWVGMDAYNTGLSPTLHIKSLLRPDQQLILVPGGSYGERPEPFVQYAQSDTQVVWICPFIWEAPAGQQMPSIKDYIIKEAYVAAGKEITGK